MKIGKLVQSYTENIFAYCENNPSELQKLMDKNYAKRTFSISSFPFCVEADAIPAEQARGKKARFWKQNYRVQGKIVRVCSQWYENHRTPFVNYLIEKGIVSKEEAKKLMLGAIANVERSQRTSSSPANMHSIRRDGGAPLANAQNAFVRHILSYLGNESFSAEDWETVEQNFGKQCAYCGKVGEKLERDHAVPINRMHLGEHRLGNLVPACSGCNAEKHGRDYREFLEGNERRINQIEKHMRDNGYLPLKDLETFEQLREVVEVAYQEIAQVAGRYQSILNLMLNKR